jgi:hypothetical protein
MPEQTDLEKVAELLNVEILPPLDANEIQSLHKSLPGYQAVADDAARFVQKHKDALKLDAAVLAGLEQGLAEVKRLEPAEHLLDKLHLSVYHQRLQATDRCMEGMYDLARPAASATLPRRILKLPRKDSSFLISWGLSSPGRRGRRRNRVMVGRGLIAAAQYLRSSRELKKRKYVVVCRYTKPYTCEKKMEKLVVIPSVLVAAFYLCSIGYA